MNVKENVLGVIDSPVVMMMRRGSEGFFVLNKSADRFDIPVLDLTLTNLEGCYRELRRKSLSRERTVRNLLPGGDDGTGGPRNLRPRRSLLLHKGTLGAVQVKTGR